MKQGSLLAVNPVLPSQDLRRSIEFYVQRLGFILLFQDSQENPGYAGLGRDRVAVHIQWHDPAEWAAVERPQLRFVVSEVQALFEEYRDKNVFHSNTELRETDWGTREFAFFDPDRNGLIFYCDR